MFSELMPIMVKHGPYVHYSRPKQISELWSAKITCFCEAVQLSTYLDMQGCRFLIVI